jgi:cellulose synthase/poly-beta-1,6-N-acetylglucosamine synthase-like glycosyltransferase
LKLDQKGLERCHIEPKVWQGKTVTGKKIEIRPEQFGQQTIASCTPINAIVLPKIARNIGLASIQPSTQFAMFLDSDDVNPSGKIACQLVFLHANPALISVETAKHKKVIVVDDGSTDGTRALALESNLATHVITIENLGCGGATTRGFPEVTAEYIAFSDPDDVWLPNKSEILLQYLASHSSVDGVFGEM